MHVKHDRSRTKKEKGGQSRLTIRNWNVELHPTDKYGHHHWDIDDTEWEEWLNENEYPFSSIS